MILSEPWLETFLTYRGELAERLLEHLWLTGCALGGAILIGIPLGVLAFKFRALQRLLSPVINAVQTIPSLALLALLLPLLGIGAPTAIAALVLYCILPIYRGTLLGLESIDGDVRDAARLFAASRAQQFWAVELPLAAPALLAGLRTAAAWGVGIATLSAFIGAGGLGEFINRGQALRSTPLLMMGAVPAALMALTFDGALALLQKKLLSWRDA